jgi:hypothetical protein
MNTDEIVRELGHRADAANKRGYSGEASEWIELADLIESLQAQLAAEQITSQSLRNAANGYKIEFDAERKRANDARNELCLKCGRYHEAHNGACDGCRWGDVTEGGPQ